MIGSAIHMTGALPDFIWDRGWWPGWVLWYYPVLAFGLILAAVVYLLDWLTPKRRLGTWLLDKIGA